MCSEFYNYLCGQNLTILQKNSLRMKMQAKERFSKRLGLQAITAEITKRYDAPDEFRQFLFFVMQNLWQGLKNTREVVCINNQRNRTSCTFISGHLFIPIKEIIDVNELLVSTKY